MQRIFVYEYATAGGLDSRSEFVELRSELFREGDTMRRAVLADLAAADVATSNLLDPATGAAAFAHDTRAAVDSPQRMQRFDELVQAADGVLLIAPEMHGILTRLVARVEAQGARLLSPGSEFVTLASDKHATAEWLRARGVAAPGGWIVKAGDAVQLPADGQWIRKPLDGAGSTSVERLAAGRTAERRPYATRVESYCAGQPASVALLCGPQTRLPLLPCRQDIALDGSFAYRGGSLPLSLELDDRARRLAVSALQCLPKTQGYVGVDLILGPAADGSQDVVLEINPRLTTSYVGLRQAAQVNLAAAMVHVAQGICTTITFSSAPLRFTAAGEVSAASAGHHETRDIWTG